MLLRCILDALTVYTRYSALHYLPIAEASVIIFSYPVTVSVFSRIILKDPLDALQVISAILTVVGVALVSKLPLELQQTNTLTSFFTSSDRIYGVSMAFISTVFNSFSIICSHWLKHTHAFVLLFNTGWISIFISLIVMFSEGKVLVIPCGEPSLLIVFCSMIEVVALTLLYKGQQTEQVGVATIVRAASHITFLFCWELFFFKEIPDIWSISGVTIVIFCIMCSSLRKYLLSLPLDASMRIKFSCFI
ncbi:solute carrier family 35 member G1-like [Limulus polyphemus]|uniref:Solute carrier family 35 member G1-like n=1 Tax=Limulus polyphemus TaxID=6850 RepID=A0ABM1BN21_LIMPO|nr:solute carrier family 35 member G1-like [Limulus polyphemus]